MSRMFVSTTVAPEISIRTSNRRENEQDAETLSRSNVSHDTGSSDVYTSVSLSRKLQHFPLSKRSVLILCTSKIQR